MKVNKRQRKKMRHEQVCKLADKWRKERIFRSFTATFCDPFLLYHVKVEPDAIEIHVVPRMDRYSDESRGKFFLMQGRHPLRGNEFQVRDRWFLIREEAGGYSLFQTHPRLRHIAGLRLIDETDQDTDLRLLPFDSDWTL